MNEHQALAIRALSNSKSDNTARARMMFAKYSQAAMNSEYCESGKTPAEILADYELYDSIVEQAILWVKNAKGG